MEDDRERFELGLPVAGTTRCEDMDLFDVVIVRGSERTLAGASAAAGIGSFCLTLVLAVADTEVELPTTAFELGRAAIRRPVENELDVEIAATALDRRYDEGASGAVSRICSSRRRKSTAFTPETFSPSFFNSSFISAMVAVGHLFTEKVRSESDDELTAGDEGLVLLVVAGEVLDSDERSKFTSACSRRATGEVI